MATPKLNDTRIVLQVGSELRIKNNGDIVLDNPELELAISRASSCSMIPSSRGRPRGRCCPHLPIRPRRGRAHIATGGTSCKPRALEDPPAERLNP
jgi:hypothetical protein